jgi:putative transposase
MFRKFVSNNFRVRKINRKIGYDYSGDGYYFITTNTEYFEKCFGNIVEGRMVLNKNGVIVRDRWLWLRDHFPYVDLDEFVIMPDHFHGILIIDSSKLISKSIQQTRKIKSVSELIGAFKTTSSKLIHDSGMKYFKWHKSFWDRIIRNDRELDNIRCYIRNNPIKWDEKQNEDNTKP